MLPHSHSADLTAYSTCAATPPEPADILILGAGASGLMCALTASQPEDGNTRRIIVADAAPVLGKKIRLAGGGMGNFTNTTLGPEWYVGTDPDFVRPALRKFPFPAALGLLENFSLQWEERDFGQIFGLQHAARFVEAVADTCRAQGVVFLLKHRVIRATAVSDGFMVEFETPAQHSAIHTRRLVLALGSSAWSSSGATDAGLAIAKHFGHSCSPFRPVLVPLLLPEHHPLRGLQGISIPVGLSAGRLKLIRPLLFTHKGWSGPAGLTASCFWNREQRILIDFLPEIHGIPDGPGTGRLTCTALLRRYVPQRLADKLTQAALQAMQVEGASLSSAAKPIAEWNKQQLSILSRIIHDHDMTPSRTEGMQKAEAAAGGVLTADIDPRTCASKLHPGLYIIGELLDIAGLLGGYNLHWAFACGKAAGEALKRPR